MFRDITIGRYYPTGSIIHKMNPCVKIIINLIYMVSLFIINSFCGYGVVFLWVLIAAFVSKLPFGLLMKGLKPLKWIFLITFLINTLFTKGETAFNIGFVYVSEEGLILASKTALRLILLILGTSILTLTTSPIQLTDGVEGVLKPFTKIGVPAHEIAMMMTIALRFIPTLVEETDKILMAQKARGADFESGNIMKRAKNMVPLLVPLFLSAIRRADELSVAMEARCYSGGVGRTRLHPLEIRNYDIIIFGITILFFIFAKLLEIFL